MSDLKLVSPDQPTAFEQRLLDAVATESPSAEQRQRVRLALGLPTVAPTLSVPMAPVGRRALLLKASGGLVVISVALVVLFSGRARQSSSAAQAVSAHVAQPVSAPPPAIAVSPVEVPEAVKASPAVAALEPVAPSAAALPHEDNGANKRANKSSAVDSGGDLSEQLRLIDAARSAIAAGNPSAASAALGSYRTRFPRGLFGQEAAVLQIQTLDLQGNHAQAAAQARNFLARHPNSPHVGVVKRIAGH